MSHPGLSVLLLMAWAGVGRALRPGPEMRRWGRRPRWPASLLSPGQPFQDAHFYPPHSRLLLKEKPRQVQSMARPSS